MLGVVLTHPMLCFYVGSFSYTSRAAFIFIWGVSLTHPMLASFLSGEFLLHIPCYLHFYLGSFSYKSHANVIFIWGVSLTHPELPSGISIRHPMLASHSCGEFLLQIPCCIDFYARSFSYTFRTAFVFFSCFSRFFPFLTHPMLASFLSVEFLLHLPCWLHIYLGTFS